MDKIINLLKKYKTSILLAVVGLIDILNGYSQEIIISFNLTNKEALIFKVIMTSVLYWRLKVETSKVKR